MGFGNVFPSLLCNRPCDDPFQRLELVYFSDREKIKRVCRFLAFTGQTTIEFWTRRAEKVDPEIADV